MTPAVMRSSASADRSRELGPGAQPEEIRHRDAFHRRHYHLDVRACTGIRSKRLGQSKHVQELRFVFGPEIGLVEALHRSTGELELNSNCPFL